MALPAKPIEEIVTMNAAERTEYFEEYARFFEDAPQKPYAIRIGSRTLFSADTMDLKIQFTALVRKLKRKQK